jgi:signal transduction histidine kinase
MTNSSNSQNALPPLLGELSLLRDSIDLFSFPLALVNNQGIVLVANNTWLESMELKPGEFIFQNWKLNNSDKLSIQWRKILEKVPQNGQKLVRIETSTHCFDFFFSWGKGAAENTIWIRSERTSSSDETSEKLAREERMNALAEMAAGIAHEILNPLTIIAGKTSLLRYTLSNPEDQSANISSYLQSINTQCSRITKIVKAMRTFSRNDADDPLQSAPLKQMIDEAIALCSEKARLTGTQFQTEDLPGDLIVSCRAVQVTQILINLLGNAIDATQDSKFSEVRIRHRISNEFVEILVSDNGPGVPEHLTNKIFQPFFTTKEVGKGTGLGLSLSIRLSQSNGGDLYIDRAVGPSCFVLRLKLEKPVQKAV